jgi:hypothetical protein
LTTLEAVHEREKDNMVTAVLAELLEMAPPQDST